MTDPKFNPGWLNIDIPDVDKQRVIDWLVDHKIDVNECAGFDYDPVKGLIRAKMYLMDSYGRPQMRPNGDILYAEDRFFEDATPPPVVTSCVNLHSAF